MLSSFFNSHVKTGRISLNCYILCFCRFLLIGSVAQLAERALRMREAPGSKPGVSTSFSWTNFLVLSKPGNHHYVLFTNSKHNFLVLSQSGNNHNVLFTNSKQSEHFLYSFNTGILNLPLVDEAFDKYMRPRQVQSRLKGNPGNRVADRLGQQCQLRR